MFTRAGICFSLFTTLFTLCIFWTSARLCKGIGNTYTEHESANKRHSHPNFLKHFHISFSMYNLMNIKYGAIFYNYKSFANGLKVMNELINNVPVISSDKELLKYIKIHHNCQIHFYLL